MMMMMITQQYNVLRTKGHWQLCRCHVYIEDGTTSSSCQLSVMYSGA